MQKVQNLGNEKKSLYKAAPPPPRTGWQHRVESLSQAAS